MFCLDLWSLTAAFATPGSHSWTSPLSLLPSPTLTIPHSRPRVDAKAWICCTLTCPSFCSSRPSNCFPTCSKRAWLARSRVSSRMGRTISYAVMAAKAVTSTKSAVSHTRMLTRGLRPAFGERYRLALRQETGPSPPPRDPFLAEDIPDTPRGVDELGVAGVALDLLAEVADVDVHRALVAELVAPHPPEQRAARENPARARGEGHEELELGVGEIHLLAPYGDPAAGEVDAEPIVVELVGALARRDGGPAHDRPHARDQLTHCERLGDVVVCPQLQPHDPVYLVVLGRQHDDGHVALGADPTADLRAIELWEHDVEDDEVRLVGLEGLEGLLTVAHRFNLETLPLEGVRQHLLERRFVVHNEYLAGHAL